MEDDRHHLSGPIFRRSKIIEGRPNVEESDNESEMNDRQRITVPGWPGDLTYRKPDGTSAAGLTLVHFSAQPEPVS